MERLTLRDAAERASFTILVPGPMPALEPASVDVHYSPPRLGSCQEDVTLFYHGPHSLWLTEKAAAGGWEDESKYEWEKVERGGQAMWVSDPGGEGKRIVSLERHGTRVTIHSDLDRDTLLDLAVSLAPAPAASPAP
jgi:hypothetical protein